MKMKFKSWVGLLAYAGFYRLMELTNYFLIMRAVGVEVPYVTMMVIGAVVMFVGEIPVTFLGLGTREAAIMLAAARFGPPETLLAAGVLISMVEYVMPNLIGLAFTKRFLDKMMGKRKS